MSNRKQNPFDSVWDVLDYLANNFTLFGPVRDLISKLTNRVEGYETLLQEKADDIQYEGKKVYLTSYGKRLGNGMTLPDNGLSAYEIWLKNGHEGDEAEFLRDIQGERGPKGEDGKSFSLQGKKDSYEALKDIVGQEGHGWLVNGDVYLWDVSTRQWFNAGSLKGERGETGERGPQGVRGEKGETGERGPKGPDGQQGSKGDTGERGSKMYSGTGITGDSTTETAFPESGVTGALVNDRYLNTDRNSNHLGNVYICTRGGDANIALWKYECNIVGARGIPGERGPQGPAGQTGLQGEKGDPGLTDEERREILDKLEDLLNRMESLEGSNDIPVERIIIKNKLSMMGTGENHVIEYLVEPDTATHKQVELISSNESVATINSSGFINCIQPGETEITVRSKKYPGVSDSFSLEVANGYVSVKGMAFKNVPTELSVNDTAKLSITFTPENPTNKRVTYRSSDPSVLDVDSEGRLTAKRVGFAYITATSEASPFISATSSTIQVVNRRVDKSIAIGNPITSMHIFRTHDLKLSVINEYTRSRGTFICESSNELIVNIDENGLLASCGIVGTATITIRLADDPTVSTSFTLDTYVVPNEEITISSGSEYTVPRNEDLYIPYTSQIPLAGFSFYAYEHRNDEIIGTGYIDNGYMILRATNLTHATKYRLYFVVARYHSSVGYTPLAQSNIITVNIVDPVNSTTDSFNITNPITRTLVGRTHKITAVYDQGATYTSETPSVATVSYDVIRAENNGMAIIRGNIIRGLKDRYEAKMQFNVEGDVGISITNRIASLRVGNYKNILYNEYGLGGRHGVTFSSSNESVVTVGQNGFLMAKSVGKADIYLTSKYSAAVREKMTIEVTANDTPAKHIIISNKLKAIRVGTSYKLEGIRVPVNNIDTFTYNSTNPSVLYVDRFGTMVGKKPGTAQVSVICANYRETYTVRVYELGAGVDEIYISTLTGEDMYARNGSVNFPYVTVSHRGFSTVEIISGHNGQVIFKNGRVENHSIIFSGLPNENLINVYIIAKDEYGRIAGQTAPFNLYMK